MNKPVKLYTTASSPYGRLTCLVIHELGLQDDIEVVLAKTRTTGSAYYQINVSGRVPYLILDDGSGLEDSQEICTYLDYYRASRGEQRAAESSAFTWPPAMKPEEDTPDWHTRQLHRRAESLIDGLSVWVREIHRPKNEQSPGIIEHEKNRAHRLLGWWETHVDANLMQGEINLTQLMLYCAVDMDERLPDFVWREQFPNVNAFATRLSQRTSIQTIQY